MASALELWLAAMRAAYPPAAVQADSSLVSSGNVTTPTPVTRQWAALGTTPAPGTVYTLKTWWSGTWGGQTLTFYADLGGTSTSLVTVGSVFATGVASGDVVNGWAELEVEVASAATCRLHLAGCIQDTALNAGRVSDATGAPISSPVPTGITFAAGDTIAIAVAFGASAAGQTIQAWGSRFTVTGAP